MGSFGVNCWWTVPETLINGADVEAALAAHGFESTDIPAPSRRTEVSRAVYGFQNRRGKSDRRITEVAKENSSYVAYGILDQTREADEEVGFRQETTVRLRKDNGSVYVEGSLREEVLTEVDKFTGAITDADIRAFLRRVIRMCYGVAKRPSGGIYFVPDRFASIIESAKKVLDDLGTGARIYVERVVDGANERENVWASVEEEIEARIDDTLAAVGRIEKRASAVQTQEGKVRELNELMNVYREILGEEAKYEAIAERLSDAEKEIGAKMAEIQNAVVVPSAPARKRKYRKRGSKRLDAIVKVLTEENRPMEYHEIAKVAGEKGYYDVSKPSAAASIGSALAKAVTDGDARFVRVRRGVYALAS